MERRYIKTELRAVAKDGQRTLAGYAATFNTISEELFDERMGKFREVLLPGAFSNVLDGDTTCNVDHCDERLLGRTSSGTLRISQDETGLAFECDLPNTSYGNDAIELITRRDISGCSFAFDIGEDDWTETADGTPLRQIKSIACLYDVSAVVTPAYPKTQLSLRSLDKWRAIQTPPPCVSIEDDLDIRRRILALQEKL